MQKAIEKWDVRTLLGFFPLISFPEYQREATVWGRAAKQALIDSILRNFDIAALYFYSDDEDSIECIDGRQRIGAIRSFLGKNDLDQEDNGFPLRIENEIYEDEQFPFASLNGLTFREIRARAERVEEPDQVAIALIRHVKEYNITVVLLEKSNDPAEFNLQFTRLNLGQIINSGEKLNAMTGDVRDACFGPESLARHEFFSAVRIPERRFSKEQLCAQIVAQCFAFFKGDWPTRTRHFDLQRLFKAHRSFGNQEKGWMARIVSLLDTLSGAPLDAGVLRNRAITVSVILLALKLDLVPGHRAQGFAQFVDEFVCRLRWQVLKRRTFQVDEPYQYLFEFQKHLTQASVEKPAVSARARMLEDEWTAFEETHQLLGDKEFLKDNPDSSPSDLCHESIAPATEG